MIAVRRSGSSMAPIGSWTADATCSEGHVVSRGGLRGGGGGEEGRGLAPVCGGPVKSTCIEVQLVVTACVLGTCSLTNEEGWWLYCPIG